MSRAERQRLYRHWLEAKATAWGTEINSLVVELEEEQARLAQLYDRASLQVSYDLECRGVQPPSISR